MTSYGLSSINLVDALHKLGHEISLIPIGNVSVDPGCPHTHESIKESLRRGQIGYNTKSPCVRIFHSFSQREFCGKGPHIGFVIFELDELNDTEKYHLNNLDACITCSNWGKEVLDNELEHKRNYVVPLGVDQKVFYPGINKSKTTTYLHVGKTEFRKSSHEICQVFNQTFKPLDNVKLQLAWTSIFNTQGVQEEWNNFAKSLPISPCIEIIPRLDSVVQVAELMRNCDAVVSLSKSEGFNFPIAEGICSNKPVIATRCTGQLQFCTDENCMFVDVKNKITAADGVWFKSGIGKWYNIEKPQKEQFSKHLRKIYEDKQNGINICNPGCDTLRSTLTWENSAKKLIEVLQYV